MLKFLTFSGRLSSFAFENRVTDYKEWILVIKSSWISTNYRLGLLSLGSMNVKNKVWLFGFAKYGRMMIIINH